MQAAKIKTIAMEEIFMDTFFSNNDGYIPNEGFVPDKETAIRIAEAVWLPIYEDSINDKKPFIAEYNEEEECWEVYGTLPENMLGGVPEIKIRKSDGKILYVSHGK